ncbi:quercetin dioxygenase-like cupin family protein [Paraburkholderia sp. BL6669N2]|uniref:cupin domain-containing protein n=1 Tax=Paraburkholderia sp. BL6669N2 TaxID=1938807 RepID=UPI000E244592|nr:cupin domain-containing protein [Paraburkholderia sp. BL6669N2]REG49829.1 quercetin dioxygenase-like cupin family protein [Paraburkholderia sp. BL6669N2]
MTCTGGVVKKPDFGDEKNATKDRYAEEPAWTTRFSSRKRLRQAIWLPLWFAVWMVAALSHMESGQATPASGFTGTTLAQGTFAEFQVMNRLTQDQLQRFAPGFPGDTWSSFEKTEGPSDVYIQTNTWAPGGTTGWHRHPGHSLIVITSGQLTEYHANCTPQVYGPGTANGTTLVDGGNDEHLIRNEGSVAATGLAVQIVAKGAQRRIDEPSPKACSSIF